MWRTALRFSAVGLELGVAIAVGYGFGWWLDTKFGTKPYLALAGLLCGIGAGVVTMVRVTKELNKFNEDYERWEAERKSEQQESEKERTKRDGDTT